MLTKRWAFKNICYESGNDGLVCNIVVHANVPCLTVCAFEYLYHDVTQTVRCPGVGIETSREHFDSPFTVKYCIYATRSEI